VSAAIGDEPREPAKPRRQRGSQAIYRKGTDRATGKPRLFARFTVDGKRYHVKLEATGMDAARAELVARIAAAREGRPYREAPKVEAPKLTVRELAEKFKAECQNPDVWNVEAYRRDMWSAFNCHLLPFLGDKAVADVRRADVARWRDDMKANGRSKRQIIRGMAAASKLWNWAIELGHLPDGAQNPLTLVGKPQADQSTDFYTDAEVARLLATAAEHAPSLHGVIAFAYYTGCRRGEIAALRWGDVDLEGGRIVISRSWKRDARKSGKAVVVTIHPHLGAILAELAPEDRAAAADLLVFPDADGKMRRSHDSKRGCWGMHDVIKQAKVRRLKMPIHAFRHSHGSALAAGGANLKAIQLALGQSTLQMAARYTEIAAEQVREHVAKLPALGPVAPSKVASLHVRRKDTERTQTGTEAEAEAKR
jgi:integrase